MIYPQHVFVALTGLGLASAAPVRHTTNATAAHNALIATSAHNALIAPGKAAPLGYVQKIKESDYTPACYMAWQFFNQDRCWCYTGCALDCSQGGEPGTPGKDIHPQWCDHNTDDDKKACEEFACDLVTNCDDVADDLKPGLDKIVSTGGYTCPTAGVAAYDYNFLSSTLICVGGKANAFNEENAPHYAAPGGDKVTLEVSFDGEPVASGRIRGWIYTSMGGYSHPEIEGGKASLICTYTNTDTVGTSDCAFSGWGSASANWESCGSRFSYNLIDNRK